MIDYIGYTLLLAIIFATLYCVVWLAFSYFSYWHPQMVFRLNELINERHLIEFKFHVYKTWGIRTIGFVYSPVELDPWTGSRVRFGLCLWRWTLSLTIYRKWREDEYR